MDLHTDFRTPTTTVGATTVLGWCVWRSEHERDQSPAAVIDTTSTVEELESVLDTVTGFFTILTPTDDGVAILTDVVNSIPLVYTVSDGTCHVSDRHPPILATAPALTVDPVSRAEYRSATYVTGHRTLFEEIAQTEAGSIVELTPAKTTRHQYFRYRCTDCTTRQYESFIHLIETVAERAADYADGRPIWLALSGGYDSRLLAVALHRQGYSNLQTYSYGRAENPDASTAEAVAGALGLDWTFVEYTPERWQQWYASETRKQLDESHWITSTLPLGDWPAVWWLRQQGHMPGDAVVLTGHGGMLSGSNLLRELFTADSVSTTAFVDALIGAHFDRNDIPQAHREAIRDRLRAATGFSGGSGLTAAAYADAWELRERQSKHLTYHTRTLAHHDVDWYLPLFDAEYVSWWTQTTPDQRTEQAVYREYVDRLYRAETGRAPPDSAGRSASPIGRLLEGVRSVVAGTRLESTLLKLYTEYLQTPRAAYDGVSADPRGILTVMPYERFEELYTGDVGLASYRARELLGEISLQDDDWQPPIERLAASEPDS